MKKIFLVALLFTALFIVGIVWSANYLPHSIPYPTGTPTIEPTTTNTPEVCDVQTGIEGGTVNLRTCAGTSCGVMQVLTEGERLQIIATGAWMNVITGSGVTGYINSNYCKGK
jgi:uncharacterized protein YgiM (DUF1202 family)